MFPPSDDDADPENYMIIQGGDEAGNQDVVFGLDKACFESLFANDEHMAPLRKLKPKA
jgi:hypothetical protein